MQERKKLDLIWSTIAFVLAVIFIALILTGFMPS